MIKMLIALDEERVKSDGIYDLADMWRLIDEKFVKGCTKEVQPDGSVLYSGMQDKDYYTSIASAYMILGEKKWFAQYCTKWIWYDYSKGGELLSDEDVLAKERKRNPLFVAG